MIIKLECSEREAQALVNLIDTAVRASGIRGAADAVGWIVKIEEAVKAAQGREAQVTGNESGEPIPEGIRISPNYFGPN